MRMSYSLTLEQKQKLVMTPELRQAIAVLQLPMMELAELVQQEVLENPLLELKEDDIESEVAPLDTREAELDIDWIQYFHDSSDIGYVTPPEEQRPAYENLSVEVPSLQDHLKLQLHVLPLNSKEVRVGEYIIGNLNEQGYLACSTQDIAQALNVDHQLVLRVLGTIQTFDPPGIGARNLKECLKIQLDYLQEIGSVDDREVELAHMVVDHHLEELANGKLMRIANKLGVSPMEIQKVVDLVKGLDPKPGRRFGWPGEVKYVMPDVVVERVEGEYVILVNDSIVPRLGLNQHYHRLLLAADDLDEEVRKFIKNKLQSAVWFLKSLEQRRHTLYRVVETIVQRQREFLDRGIRYLKPLTLKEVAEAVGLHESTVSRATANKYVQTPQGVFELRFFFSSRLSKVAGTPVSSTSVKQLIQDFIANENPFEPYSDKAIMEYLNSRGIMISRRTVAKYREELNVPCSAKRRRF